MNTKPLHSSVTFHSHSIYTYLELNTT
jgi:hypothetical protein